MLKSIVRSGNKCLNSSNLNSAIRKSTNNIRTSVGQTLNVASSLKSYTSSNSFVLNSNSTSNVTTPISSIKQSTQITNILNNNGNNGIIRNMRGVNGTGVLEMLTVFLDNDGD